MQKRADGIGAWRALVHEFEPETAGRYCAMLANILTPPWTEDIPFMDQLLAWEKLIGDYEMIAGAAVPDLIQCAVVQRWATKEVKEVLRVTPIDIGLDCA
eukprot:7362969-Heterocapsa_arctica.AAC.1